MGLPTNCLFQWAGVAVHSWWHAKIFMNSRLGVSSQSGQGQQVVKGRLSCINAYSQFVGCTANWYINRLLDSKMPLVLLFCGNFQSISVINGTIVIMILYECLTFADSRYIFMSLLKTLSCNTCCCSDGHSIRKIKASEKTWTQSYIVNSRSVE